MVDGAASNIKITTKGDLSIGVTGNFMYANMGYAAAEGLIAGGGLPGGTGSGAVA